MFSYDILIPAYNAEKQIGQLLAELNRLNEPPERIILIDDGSEDRTAEIARQFDIRIYQLAQNQGKGIALKTGFDIFLKESQSDYLLCMDADLQHSTDAIPDFIERVRSQKSTFIIGKRARRKSGMPVHRILSNSITSWILGVLSGQKIEDSQCGYRLIHKTVLKDVQGHLFENGFQMESEFIVRAAQHGYSVDFVDIPTIYNREATSIRNITDTLKFIRFVLRNAGRKK